MQMITTIGLDIAKSVFQVHGVDAAGQVVVRRQLKRRYVWRSSRSCRLPNRHRGCAHPHWFPGSHCTTDAAGLGEALRQAAEE